MLTKLHHIHMQRGGKKKTKAARLSRLIGVRFARDTERMLKRVAKADKIEVTDVIRRAVDEYVHKIREAQLRIESEIVSKSESQLEESN
jgi:hypothetical protein